ncbi:MAG: hypothetical protein CSA58_05605 [Micrococcales bacterium]|nr:MAG: hypothetical protein CSB46_04030 [Micrococcales bacterium]PIE27185.1 MAG: hypothetical protein CSA58_05605 [Micrococcales bacterium]
MKRWLRLPDVDGPAVRAYQRLLTAALLSNLGDGMRRIAMPLLAATLTHDPLLVGVLSSAVFLPYLFFAVPAGVYSDRMDRRTAMIGATVTRAGALTAMCLSLVSGTVAVWQVFVLSLVLGGAECLYDTSADAALPTLVPAAALDRANARLQGVITVANEFLGGPAGGFLFAAVAVGPFAVELGAALLVIALITGLPSLTQHRRQPDEQQQPAGAGTGAQDRRTPAPGHLRSVLAETIAGIRWLLGYPQLRALALLTAVGGLCLELAQATMVLFALHVLHLPEAAFGVFASAAAVGGVLGVSVVGVLVARFSRFLVMSCALMAQPLFLFGVGVAPNPVLAWVSLALVAAAVGVWNVLTVTARQLLTPNAVYGRVQGVWRTVIWGALPIGAVLGGLIAREFGLRAPWLAGAAVFLLVAAGCLPVVRRVCTLVDAQVAQRGAVPAEDTRP